MNRKESRMVKIYHKGEKQQGKKVLENPVATISVPPSQIKTSQQTTSEYEVQHKLEIIVNQGWRQVCSSKYPRQFQHQLTDLVKKTIITEHSFFKKVCYFINTLGIFIKQKRFLLNWDISQILAMGKRISTDFRILFKQEYLLQLKSKDNQHYQEINQGLPRSIKNVIHTYYQLFKVQGIPQSYTVQQDTYLEQLKQSFFNLSLTTKDSHFLSQKSKINFILQDFMMTVFCNQYILIVTNLLEILNRLHTNNTYFTIFLKQWKSDVVSCKDKLKIIKQKLKIIHDKCIKMAKQYESDQEYFKKPFQDRKKQKKGRQKSQNNTNFKKNQQKDKTQLIVLIRGQQSSKIYIKGYFKRTNIQKMKWVNQIYVKYIEVDRADKNNILNYKLKAKVQQNQMNVLRYLRSIKRKFVFKYDISIDRHPEYQEYQKQNSTMEPTICFEFQSKKADKDYATRVNKNSKQTITTADLWGYKDRNIIYNFFFCFATSIDQLEKHFIHHLDFSYENFIKFYQIFEVIDMEYAYVVNKDNYNFLKLNRELFEIWLQTSVDEPLQYLILSSKTKYSLIKGQYFKNQISRQQAVKRCIQLMHANMTNNHYSQFHTLCHNLLSHKCINQIFPLSKDEIDQIRCQIPQNSIQNPIALKDFYKKFISHLRFIFEKYSHSRQIMGKSSYQLIKDLQKITNNEIAQETRLKIIRFIQKFQRSPLENCLQYDQIINQSQDIVAITRKDHKLFDLYDIYEKQRFLVQFFMSCVLLFEELAKNGLLLLNLGIQSFVWSGEAFKLKNFAYLFKVGPRYSELYFSEQQDVQLTQISLSVLAKLTLLEKSELKGKLFDDTTLKIIYEIVFLDHTTFGCQNLPTMQRIRQFFQRSSKEIHFNQFTALALQMLQNAPKHFLKTEELKGIIKQKHLANFYELFEDLRSMDIVSSY